MFETRLELEGRSLILRARADLAVKGADRADVWIRLPEGEAADVRVESGEATVEVALGRSAEVKVPAGTSLHVALAKGNLALHGLDVAVDVEKVCGNLGVKGCAGLEGDHVRGNASFKAVSEGVHLNKVAGNLTVKDVDGDLEVGTVRGNAALSGIQGLARAGRIGGNLAARKLAGGLDVEAVGGNVALSGPWMSGQVYRVSAGGNAIVRIEPETNVQVRALAGGHLLSSVPLQPDEAAPGWRTGATGEAGAELEIRAGGNLVVGAEGDAGAVAGWASLGADLAQDAIQQAMNRLQTRLESVDWDRVGRKAEAAVERAMERVERKLERAMARSERARARAERAHPHVEEVRRPRPVSREERLRILEQVSAKEIDVDKALKLLRG